MLDATYALLYDEAQTADTMLATAGKDAHCLHDLVQHLEPLEEAEGTNLVELHSWGDFVNKAMAEGA